MKGAVKASNRAGLALYQQLRTETGNIACSPASISVALAMTYAGARSRTAEEMKKTLAFPDSAALHEGWASVIAGWQKVENESVEMAARISREVDNPLVRTVMGIILQDSATHHRVQQLIIDSFEREAFSLQPEEVGSIWGMIEEHIALERKTIEHAKAALDAIKGTKMDVQQYLLEYMLIDEEKHNRILDSLEAVKKGIYPYA